MNKKNLICAWKLSLNEGNYALKIDGGRQKDRQKDRMTERLIIIIVQCEAVRWEQFLRICRLGKL